MKKSRWFMSAAIAITSAICVTVAVASSPCPMTCDQNGPCSGTDADGNTVPGAIDCTSYGYGSCPGDGLEHPNNAGVEIATDHYFTGPASTQVMTVQDTARLCWNKITCVWVQGVGCTDGAKTPHNKMTYQTVPCPSQ